MEKVWNWTEKIVPGDNGEFGNNWEIAISSPKLPPVPPAPAISTSRAPSYSLPPPPPLTPTIPSAAATQQ
jgi:hypothetical protein